MAILDIKNLSISLHNQNKGKIPFIDRVNLSLKENYIHVLLGENGSGKSLIAKSVANILSSKFKVVHENFLYFDKKTLSNKDIAVICKDPKKNFSDILTIKKHFLIALDKKKTDDFCDKKIDSIFHQVSLKDPQKILKKYPAQLSKSEIAKVSLALAIIKDPKVLIIDELEISTSTNSLNIIICLLKRLNKQHNTAILFMTSNINLALILADYLSVLYCGQIVESANVEQIKEDPKHPYTKHFIAFARAKPKQKIKELKASVAKIDNLPVGCRLAPRCPYATKECIVEPKLKKHKNIWLKCHFMDLL